MNKELIERYIQFALDNDLKTDLNLVEWWYFFEWNKIIVTTEWEWIEEWEINITELITSWPFIEAIARWITKDWCITEDYEILLKEKIKWIFIHQAKALANFEWDTLDEFIENLLPKK